MSKEVCSRLLRRFFHQLASDGERLFGGGFLAAVLAVALAVIASGGKQLFPGAEELGGGLSVGYHRELFARGLRGEALIFLLPVAAALPFAASWLDERKNGYWKAYLPRVTRESYALSRVTANTLGGGLVCFLGGLLAYLALALIYRPLEAAGEGEGLGAVFLSCGALFFAGALWAGLGLLFGLLFRNRYMIYGGPFLCNYLLIILTTRYFPGAYTLNPREWLAMKHYWEGGGLGVLAFLAELVLISSLLQYLVLKWRLEP